MGGNVKKQGKIGLLITTLLPLVYMIFFIMFVFFMVFFLAPHWEASSIEGPPSLFFIIFPVHFLIILLIWGLVIFYIVNVYKSNKVPKQQRVLWVFLLIFGGIIAMLFYWYLYIWKEDGKQTTDYNHIR